MNERLLHQRAWGCRAPSGYPDAMDERLFRTDFLGEAIEGDALGTGDVSLVGVVLPRREDKQATLGDCIKESIRGFEELAEAVVGKEDDKTILL